MADDSQSPSAGKPIAKSDPENWTLGRMLEWTTQHLKKHGSDTPRLDAEILLAFACKCPRIQLYVRHGELATDAQRTMMRDLVKRRAAAEPVAYLVGHREFFGIDFRVNSSVLIPRPDTETLVVDAITLARQLPEPRILDLCTGSGCIAISLAVNVPTATVVATDISPTALDVARENAAAHTGRDRQPITSRLSFVQSDLFTEISQTPTFDIIVSNPPYIPTAELATLDADVRDHEPHLALDGGGDGLQLIQKIVTTAPDFLSPGGLLLLEFSPEQVDAVQQLATDAGRYSTQLVLKDVAGRARAIRAVRR